MKFSAIILFIILSKVIYSQQAIDYFPRQFGYTWNYRLSVLDSSNNTIPEMIFFRKDSSAFLSEYNGKEAYHILTKTGTEETIQFLPYIDTNYVSLTGSDGYEFFTIFALEPLLNLVDSSTFNFLIPFMGLFESLSDWHSVYRFNQNLNQQYQIFTYDTSITIDSMQIPIRFNTSGIRPQDETLETEIGTFLCKKFVLTSSVNYLVFLPPPLPPIVIPILTTIDTVWIAPVNWIVKDIIPSTNIDLTLFNLGEYLIPGLKREIISETTGVEENPQVKFAFNLEQNFPNPFNPTTKIKFSISLNPQTVGLVTLRVYDILGKEVVKLIEKELGSGNYETFFDGKNLSSGVYFYTLEFTEINSGLSYRTSKQMSLIK